MWLFAKQGFFSIVQDKKDKNILIVRARAVEDIHKYFPRASVIVNEKADYRYRAYISKKDVADAMHKIVMDIDYNIFKNSIDDYDRRKDYYLEVWSTMYQMQDDFELQDRVTEKKHAKTKAKTK